MYAISRAEKPYTFKLIERAFFATILQIERLAHTVSDWPAHPHTTAEAFTVEPLLEQHIQ